MDSADAVAPGPADCFGKEPAAVALAGQFRDEPDERELALAGLAIIEIENADVRPALVNDGKQVDAGIVDNRGERFVVPDQPREP